ncbi:MAG: hypothetical protein U0U46_21660 [Saprospiraceae bacterium]
MKTLLTLLLLLSLSIACSGQSDSLVWRYADLTYPVGGFNSKSKVVVDYGENVQRWLKRPEMIEGPDGKEIKFKSPIDALNFMSLNGWELVQSYMTEESAGLGGNLKYIHFIMRRKEPIKE